MSFLNVMHEMQLHCQFPIYDASHHGMNGL